MNKIIAEGIFDNSGFLGHPVLNFIEPIGTKIRITFRRNMLADENNPLCQYQKLISMYDNEHVRLYFTTSTPKFLIGKTTPQEFSIQKIEIVV